MIHRRGQVPGEEKRTAGKSSSYSTVPRAFAARSGLSMNSYSEGEQSKGGKFWHILSISHIGMAIPNESDRIQAVVTPFEAIHWTVS